MNDLAEFMKEMPVNELGETLRNMFFTDPESLEPRIEFADHTEWVFDKKRAIFLSGRDMEGYKDEEVRDIVNGSKGFSFGKFGLNFDVFWWDDLDEVTLDFWVKDNYGLAIRHIRNVDFAPLFDSIHESRWGDIQN